MKYVDLFAGIGGFRLGIERAFEKKAERVWKESSQRVRSKAIAGEPQGTSRLDYSGTETQQHDFRSPDRQFTCVYTNEWDKYAAQIYEKNFKTKVDTRDITTVRTDEIPDHDLLCAGFPCQAFSVAGKRRGFDDTRGTLFFDIARILKDKRPRYFLLENVKGLLSHDSGKTFQTILGVLSDLGYEYQWQVLNSKDFGVPQNRERVFIIGHLRGTSRPEVFPIGGSGKSNDNQITSNAIDTNYWKGIDNHGQRTMISDSLHGFGHGWQGYHNKKAVKMGLIRRLTPTECERLQGFPDGWTEGVSDTQRYKMLGNAVTVNVVEEVIKRMFLETTKALLEGLE